MTDLIDNDSLSLSGIETRPFGTNAYILTCGRTRHSLLIDAPGDADKILTRLNDTEPRLIVVTHGHYDHTGALEALRQKLDVPVAAHVGDAARLPVRPNRIVEDGEILNLGRIRLHVLHTPGHTPGSLCLHTDGLLISGDTLFPGGPGRTATPADFRILLRSLEDRILTLPDDVRVYPGHGPPALLGVEKKAFLRFKKAGRFEGLCGDVLWSQP